MFYRIILSILVLSALHPTNAWTDSQSPLWTEKSSWLEGNELRATGIASHAKTKEAGRQAAYENGLKEIQNFFSSIGGSIPEVQTQMTYEESNSDGTYDVYRLLKLDISGLERKSFQNKYKSRLGHTDTNSGSLKVVTVPPGAEIYLNSEFVGRSNAELSDVGQGKYQLTLKLQGYHPKSIPVEVGDTASIIQETLDTKIGTLSIEGNDGATAEITGLGKITIPGKLSGLVLGKTYSVHISKSGYLPQDRSFTLVDDFERVLNVNLDPLPAEITVLSDPDEAAVSINGEDAGRTPLRSYKVKPGEIKITISMAGYQNQSIKMQVEPDERKLVPIVKMVPLTEVEKQNMETQTKKEQDEKNPAPLILGFTLEYSSPTASFPNESYSTSFGLSGEWRFLRTIGLRINSSYESLEAKTNGQSSIGGHGFENSLTLPFYHFFDDTRHAVYAGPKVSVDSQSYTPVGAAAIRSTQTGIGGCIGYQYAPVKGGIGGQVDLSVLKYNGSSGYSGNTAPSLSGALLIGF